MQDSYETKKRLMNSSSIRVVPGSEGSYGPDLTATDAYHFAFPAVTDADDALPSHANFPAPPSSFAEESRSPEWLQAMKRSSTGIGIDRSLRGAAGRARGGADNADPDHVDLPT